MQTILTDKFNCIATGEELDVPGTSHFCICVFVVPHEGAKEIGCNVVGWWHTCRQHGFMCWDPNCGGGSKVERRLGNFHNWNWGRSNVSQDSHHLIIVPSSAFSGKLKVPHEPM
jgi:hypothetical protein